MGSGRKARTVARRKLGSNRVGYHGVWVLGNTMLIMLAGLYVLD